MSQKVSVRPIFLALVFVFLIPMVRVATASPDTVFVVNSKDAGPGSFRSAILLANGDPTIRRVLFLGHVSKIFLTQKVEFGGRSGSLYCREWRHAGRVEGGRGSGIRRERR